MSFVGGSLKLKGLKPLVKTKAIKKDPKPELAKEKLAEKLVDQNLERKEEAKEPVKHTMTESERKFREIQLVRLQQRIEQNDAELMVSHRKKIETFNKKLANLPEHNDIPKVGPG